MPLPTWPLAWLSQPTAHGKAFDCSVAAGSARGRRLWQRWAAEADAVPVAQPSRVGLPRRTNRRAPSTTLTRGRRAPCSAHGRQWPPPTASRRQSVPGRTRLLPREMGPVLNLSAFAADAAFGSVCVLCPFHRKGSARETQAHHPAIRAVPCSRESTHFVAWHPANLQQNAVPPATRSHLALGHPRYRRRVVDQPPPPIASRPGRGHHHYLPETVISRPGCN